ncbi:MAG: NAD(P)H-hydrate dehydratase [Pirellulales bacterium]|nr:NAD(P)H-hydrate dehydratase [Pirellulales bacterium]
MTISRDDTPLLKLPKRAPETHKGDYGRALLVGGSQAMGGAIALAGMAALRGGAGLVRLATPASCHTIVASFNPCYMVAPLSADEKGALATEAREELAELAADATCVGCGPGLSTSAGVQQVVSWLYTHFTGAAVFDADALNVLARQRGALSLPGGPRILTPHPGEFRRLLGAEGDYDEAAREQVAAEFAANHRAIVLLKGHRTLVTDGERVSLNTTGNPGMATGGTGDVLTGLLVALLCQGLAPYDAARLGAHWHGLAGDLAAAELGEASLTARDLIDYLPAAIRRDDK